MKEPGDDELRALDHEAQSGKSALMYQASPGGIDMNPVYAAGRRAVFRAGRDFERKSLDAARDEAPNATRFLRDAAANMLGYINESAEEDGDGCQICGEEPGGHLQGEPCAVLNAALEGFDAANAGRKL